MTARLTYSQLEGVWIQAGGQASLAPLMAAIALAESGGNPNSLNATDNGGTQSSFGLWQISTGTHTPPASNWNDPVENARLAIGKLHSQGLAAWGTYTSGAYKPFLKNGVPASAVSSATLSADAASASGIQTAADVTSTDLTCAWNLSLPVAGQTCIITKVQLRSLIGGFLMLAGSGLVVTGVVLLIALGFRKDAGAIVGALAK